jgi:hypothetical protein
LAAYDILFSLAGISEFMGFVSLNPSVKEITGNRAGFFIQQSGLKLPFRVAS